MARPLPSSWLPGFVAVAAAALLGACSSNRVPLDPAPVVDKAPVQAQPQANAKPEPSSAAGRAATRSAASNARAYRTDAASHLYDLNRDRIYKGRLPPMLYAIGVLQVEVDRSGNVRDLHWMRAPKHAPEVVAEIERTVRAAAPFPAPARMGKVVYTDTWLWHKSGQFQLDTLTEGQD
jgi:periplasmic protein TonB